MKKEEEIISHAETVSLGAPMSEETAKSAMESERIISKPCVLLVLSDALRRLPLLAAAAVPPAHQLEHVEGKRAPALLGSALPCFRAEESIRCQISRPKNSSLQSPAQMMGSPVKFSCFLLQIHLATHSVLT